MSLEEINGIILNPVKLKEQCALIAQNYDYENASYVLLSDRVNRLCEEEELRSNAITGFKSQMSNYKSVFDALCYANELDKYDIITLNSILDSELGSDILDGTEILWEIKQAEDYYESCLWKKSYWYSEYMNADWYEIVYSDLCYYTYKYYENLANDAVEDKTYWERRGELLLDISAKLSGLFVKGNEFRDCANEGINQIATAFNANTNTYEAGYTSWKDKLLSLIDDSVYMENGEIDWNLIEQILSKDADAISDTEYMLAAYAYMNADLEELSDFFMMCRVPDAVDKSTWTSLYLQYKLDNLSFGNMYILTLDSKKINAVCRQANIYQTNLLAIIREGDLDTESEDALIAKRGNIIQRITMAKTLDEIHSFYGHRSQKDYFNFEYTDEGLGPDKSLKVAYYSLMYAGDVSIAALDSHKFTVTNTLRDSGLTSFSYNELEDASLKELTSYSTAVVGNNITKEAMNKALTLITKSGVITFGLGLATDIYENKKNYNYIYNTWSIAKVLDVASRFDCCGNVVIYDDNTIKVSLYEGIHTKQKVEKIAILLGNDNWDTEYLLEHTSEVFQEYYDYMSEYGDKAFEEIIEGD